MTEDLRIMMDATDGLIEDLKKTTWKLDQTFFALCEECEDDPDEDELVAMLRDLPPLIQSAEGALAAISDYVTDIAKEIL
ncbi:MAG TPA: hypothetical protein VIG24_04200 [Acidimicrobiia bacterium]